MFWQGWGRVNHVTYFYMKEKNKNEAAKKEKKMEIFEDRENKLMWHKMKANKRQKAIMCKGAEKERWKYFQKRKEQCRKESWKILKK